MLESWWCVLQETQPGQYPWSLSPAFAHPLPTLPSFLCLLTLCQAQALGDELVGRTCWWRTWVQVVRQLFDTAGALHVGHLHCQKHRGILFVRLKNSHSEWLSECQPRRFWVRVCFNQPMISQVRRWHWDSLPEGHLNVFLFLSWVLTYDCMTKLNWWYLPFTSLPFIRTGPGTTHTLWYTMTDNLRC